MSKKIVLFIMELSPRTKHKTIFGLTNVYVVPRVYFERADASLTRRGGTKRSRRPLLLRSLRSETRQFQWLSPFEAAEYIFSDLIRLKVAQKRNLALECRPNPAFPGEPKRPAYCRFSDLSPFPVWAGPGPAEARKGALRRSYSLGFT